MGPNERLLRKLQSDTELTAAEADIVMRLPMRVTSLGARQDIVVEGDRPSRCCLVVEGFAVRYKLTGDGSRQILAVHIPGDVPDLQSLHLKTLDHTLATLTACKLAFIEHSDLLQAISKAPGLGGALWRETLIDAAIFREWMTGLGRRDAPQRMAHFFCELATRLRAAGLGDRSGFYLQATQQELADAMGMTQVHVNRTLKELRESGLLTMANGRVSILDWDGLCSTAQFDPAYLHLRTG